MVPTRTHARTQSQLTVTSSGRTTESRFSGGTFDYSFRLVKNILVFHRLFDCFVVSSSDLTNTGIQTSRVVSVVQTGNDLFLFSFILDQHEFSLTQGTVG